MKKNILIISYAYPPLNVPAAQRPYTIAKYLDKEKYTVTVITCENSFSSYGVDENFDASLPQVKVVKVKAAIGDSHITANTFIKTQHDSVVGKTIKSSLKTAVSSTLLTDKGVFWYLPMKKYIEENSFLFKSVDVVITTSPLITNHRLGLYFKKKFNTVQWIADFRDFYSLENTSNSLTVKAQYNKALEKKIVTQSTALTFVTQAMKQQYAITYPKQSHKMHSVTNGIDALLERDIHLTKNVNTTFSVFYGGSFYGEKRSPYELLRLLDKAVEDQLLTLNEIKVTIAGSITTKMHQKLKRYHTYSCITFLGIITRSEVAKKMRESLLLWLIVSEEVAHYKSIPLKLFEYIEAKKYILNFAPQSSEASKIILENQLGWNFNTGAENKQYNYNLFKKVLTKYKTGQLNTVDAPFNIETYNWEHCIKEFEKIMNS